MPPIEETSVNEVENTVSATIASSEFDGLTKSARRRLKRKLVSQSMLNSQNSPDTDGDEVIDELNLTEVCIQLSLH